MHTKRVLHQPANTHTPPWATLIIFVLGMDTKRDCSPVPALIDAIPCCATEHSTVYPDMRHYVTSCQVFTYLFLVSLLGEIIKESNLQTGKPYLDS